MTGVERPLTTSQAAADESSSGSDLEEPLTSQQASAGGPRRRAGLAAGAVGLLAAAIAAAGAVAARGRQAPAVLGDKGEPLLQLSTSRHVGLEVIIRDFIVAGSSTHPTFAHPDFEPLYPHRRGVQKNLVQDELGSDGKPVWKGCGGSSECSLPDERTFNQWYNTGSWNREVIKYLEVTESPSTPGQFVLDRPNFFPLTGSEGFGDRHIYVPHNYYFTMETKHTFVYHGDEWFTFRGDDDLWIFFNNKLAIDLGGVHSQATETYRLSDNEEYLGLERGQTVYLNIFFAERSFSSSNFMISTNIQLDEDACYEHDRVYLTESPVSNNLPTGAISWQGEHRTAHSMEGESVRFSFRCVEGEHCASNQKGSQGGFPTISVDAWHAMPLTFEVDQDLDKYYITFYNVVHGMSIEATGVIGYIRMGDSSISYSKVEDRDVFTSTAPIYGAAPTTPNELTEEQKMKSVMLAFASPQGVTITLKNSRPDSQVATFMFTATPMFDCIPCFPACPLNRPKSATRTTTTTTLQAEDGGAELGGSVDTASVGEDEDEYECCFIGFVGVNIMCGPDKPWWKPWCPDKPEL